MLDIEYVQHPAHFKLKTRRFCFTFFLLVCVAEPYDGIQNYDISIHEKDNSVVIRLARDTRIMGSLNGAKKWY